MSRSRTYRVLSNYSKDRRSPIVVDINVTHRAAQKHLDDFQRTWEELGYRIERTHSKVIGTMPNQRMVEVYFEKEKDD